MSSKNYKTLLNKIKEESSKIPLQSSDSFIEIKLNLFNFYEEYIQDMELYTNNERRILKNSLESVSEKLELAKNFIKLKYITELRENTNLSEEIRNSLNQIGYQEEEK